MERKKKLSIHISSQLIYSSEMLIIEIYAVVVLIEIKSTFICHMLIKKKMIKLLTNWAHTDLIYLYLTTIAADTLQVNYNIIFLFKYVWFGRTTFIKYDLILF